MPAPLLTDSDLEAAFREGATDEEIESQLRHLTFWSYIMRNPFGKVCAVGRGTRAECIENAVNLSDRHAIPDPETSWQSALGEIQAGRGAVTPSRPRTDAVTAMTSVVGMPLVIAVIQAFELNQAEPS